jgi:hypothetical protein
MHSGIDRPPMARSGGVYDVRSWILHTKTSRVRKSGTLVLFPLNTKMAKAASVAGQSLGERDAWPNSFMVATSSLSLHPSQASPDPAVIMGAQKSQQRDKKDTLRWQYVPPKS